MEPDEYRRMFEVEEALWWYRALRLYLADAFDRASLPRAARILDVGCGSGGNLAMLAGRFGRVIGCDLSEEAVRLCRTRGIARVLAADVNHLPFREATFDAVLASDVFETREVDEVAGIAEIARVTRPGGRVILNVAAFQFLLSEHDAAVHSVRRYTGGRARRAFETRGLELVGMRYLFGLFLPPIVLYRLARWLGPRRPPGTPPRSDVFLPRWPVNGMLLAVARAERALAHAIHLPFGTTLLVELVRVRSGA
jgi:SAM-dependent methyltransferase